MIRKAAMVTAVVLAATAAWAQVPATQPAATQAAATQPSAENIAALIAQLGVQKFQARKEAQRALVAIGLPAEPALREAAAHSTNAEIRARAKSALDRIEDNLPDAPTRVSVKALREDPGKALRSLAEQAGVSIVAEGGGDEMWTGDDGQLRPITLDLDRVPLLVALEKFCKATHTRPFCNGGGPDSNGLQISRQDTGVWDQEDRVAIVANQIGHDREIDLSSNAPTRRDFVTVSFYFDPRRALVDYQQPRITVAEDENGVSLVGTPDQQGNDFTGNPFLSRWGFDAQLPLNFPAKSGKTLARLEGTVSIRVATKVETMNIPNLAKSIGSAAVAGNRKVEVIGFDFNGTAGNLHLRISDTTPQKLWGRLVGGQNGPNVNLFNEFRGADIIDANGQAIQCNGGGSGSDRQIDWQGQFNAQGPQPLKGPFSLRWEVIAQTKDIAVPFKFKNLPLPPE
jgi:hypothetical protein